MARRIVNRKEKRAEYEAYERRQDENEVEEGEEEEKEDEEDEEGEEDEEPTDEEEGESEGEGEGEEEGEKPKKRKPAKEPKVKAKPKPKAKPRTRAPKAPPRMKVVWGVFSNSNQRVATYDYAKRREAEDHAAKLRNDKNQTFFVQPVKEPMEEKKEKE
jgi:hypothetical protein